MLFDINKFYDNDYWFSYTDVDIKLEDNAGKLIAYIRCDNYTTEDERMNFFKEITSLLYQHCSLPIAGKMAFTVNSYNLCPFMFYCNEHEKILLEQTLITIKDKISPIYQSWFEKNNEAKILTWNWTWKSNQQTEKELANKTHFLYRTGLKK